MKVMIIDNDSKSVEFLISCLNEIDEESEINVFESSYQVIEYVKEHPADILFTEVQLRGMSGFSLIAQVKEIQPSIFAVILTKTKDYALEAWSNRVDDYIVKSSLSVTLNSSIQYMIHHRLRR